MGVKQTANHIWVVTFMDCDLGHFDDETSRLEWIENPFGSNCYAFSTHRRNDLR